MLEPDTWFAARSLFTVLSSAYAMCANPVVGSTVSEMKSSRFRFEFGSTQKMPRLQMSPICIGVVVTAPVVHVAMPVGDVRSSDWPAYRFQLQVGG
jgi:hypothetical protein